MSRKIGELRSFKTKQFHVICDALVEDDLDLSWDDTGRVARDLQRGELIAFVARVRVFCRGREVGTDYLGNCVYKSFDDFMDHRACGKQNARYARQEQRKGLAVGSLGRCGSYFHDMIREACADARREIRTFKDIRVRGYAS